MKVEFKHSELNDTRYVGQGINWSLFFTSSLFGIPLFKKNMNKWAMFMMLVSGLFFISLICFICFTSSYAAGFPYGMGGSYHPSMVSDILLMLDLEYDEVSLFLISSIGILFLALTILSGYIAVNANKWDAEAYKSMGYKAIVPNGVVLQTVKREWNFSDNDFIIEQ